MFLSLDKLELVKQIRDGDKPQFLEVRAITFLEVKCKRNIAELKIAGSPSNVLQDIGAEPVEIKIKGKFLGKDSKKRIEQLRQMRQKGDPVELTSDSTSFANIGSVVISKFDFTESVEAVNGVAYDLEIIEHKNTK